MGKIPSNTHIKLPVVKTTAVQFWQAFNIKKGPGELHVFDDELLTGEAVVADLPDDADAFLIGVSARLQVHARGRTVTRDASTTDGRIYVPTDRCEVIGVPEVEEFDTGLSGLMIISGISKALRVPNGIMLYDPDVVTLVDIPQ